MATNVRIISYTKFKEFTEIVKLRLNAFPMPHFTELNPRARVNAKIRNLRLQFQQLKIINESNEVNSAV